MEKRNHLTDDKKNHGMEHLEEDFQDLNYAPYDRKLGRMTYDINKWADYGYSSSEYGSLDLSDRSYMSTHRTIPSFCRLKMNVLTEKTNHSSI
ncbi:MAG: hypothetical protein ACK5WZ_10020 [Pseudobdellovibrionaceae bacterium]